MLIILVVCILTISVLTQSYGCTEYHYYDYWNNYTSIQTIQPAINVTKHGLPDFSATQYSLGVGFWMNYRPLLDSYLVVNIEATYHPDQTQMFVFSYKIYEQEEYVAYFYIEMLHSDQKIYHHILFQTTTGWVETITSMDYTKYEGDWILVYWFADQIKEEISIYYYSYELGTYTQDKVSGILKLNSYMESTTGGYKNIAIPDQPILYLQGYPGLIFGVFTDPLYNIFDDFDTFLYYCQMNLYDPSYNLYIIQDNKYISNKFYSHALYRLQKNQYLLQGWVKQDILLHKSSQDQLLLRMTCYQQYLDNQQMGDRVLYILYNQDSLALQQNGFSLQTYSYTFPYKPAQYSSDQIIYVYDQKYKQLLTEWHYFQYQIGTENNNGQPLYKIYFPTLNIIEEYSWTSPINHLTSSMYYFYIGGDNFTTNQFKGYLSNWEFQYFSIKQQPDFSMVCHYTCKTCMGISNHDCLSCSPDSFRIYSSDLHTCTCQFGYLDNPNDKKCQVINDYSMIVRIYEQEVTSHDICDYGYFKYKGICIQCPYGIINNKLRIACADCYIYAEKFSTTLLCTFDFISSDINGIFNYVSTDAQLELYQISLNSEQVYELHLLKGAKGDGTCKSGYFKDYNGNCIACFDGCKICLNENTCQKCVSNYKQLPNQNCVPCQKCNHCDNYGGVETCYSDYYCKPRQYWDNKDCYDCGKNCAQCSKSQCYYCTDPEQYYLTLDNIHCEKCTIKNCKYCFQYTYLNDNQLIISLDIRQQGIDLSIYEIKTGCALCQNNLFYSYETGQCELPTIDNCEFGIITETNSICIKSQTRQDAIQTSNCKQESCISCINNYSDSFSSFCIICMDGYYSSYLTGQCLKCIDCLTCTSQNKNYSDYWKWNIRSFYKVFANNHPFENYAVSQTNSGFVSNFEIACLSCPSNYLLFNGKCFAGCNDECLDCRIVTVTNSFNIFVEYKTQCFKCKEAPYNPQRSVYPTATNNCLECPNYCSACLPRTNEQIYELNPFFNNPSLIKYTHICYSYESSNVLPKYIVPIICKEFEKCSNSLDLSFDVYCDPTQFSPEGETDQRKTIPFNMILFNYTTYVETAELEEYLNEVRITEANYFFDFIFDPKSDQCQMVYKLKNLIYNTLHQNVFTLNKISLSLFTSNTEKAPIIFGQEMLFWNYDILKFQKIKFLIQYKKIKLGKNYTNISIINDYNPVSIEFQDCELYQLEQLVKHQYIFTSNRPQKLTIKNLILNSLRIHNSAMFDYQPTVDTQSPTQVIVELKIINSQFTNTSLFYYDASKSSLNYVINFTNVTILDSQFISSFFINSTFFSKNYIGNIFLENFYLENLIFQGNSQFFSVMSGQQIQFKNITIKNTKFLDTSSFLISNILVIEQLLIQDTVINSGYYITNIGNFSQNTQLLQTSKLATLTNIKFIRNNYSNFHSFINIIQSQVQGINLNVDSLTLDSNCYSNIQIGKQSYSQDSYENALILIECTYCSFNSILLKRGLGFPEIAILKSQDLKIDSFEIQLNPQYYFRSLHTSFDCAKQFMYLDLTFVLYIGSYNLVLLNNLIIKESIILDFPFIIMIGSSSTDKLNHDTIVLQNSAFTNNLLLKTVYNRFTSLISIDSDQNTTILINNTEFNNNHLNSFQEDILQRSSTTMLIQALQAQVTIIDSDFMQNVVTNSSEAILYIKAQVLNLYNINFKNQNILNSKVFQKNLILLKDQNKQGNIGQTINFIDQNVLSNFNILSNGGNGNFFITELYITNINVSNSIAINGAGFYVTTQNEGIILIDNSQFKNTSTVLNDYQFTQGGLLYIDSSKSQLNLMIVSSFISQSYSRIFGGSIFIEPSRLKTSINLNDLQVRAVFSLQHQFLSYSPSKFISVSSDVQIKNTTFYNDIAEFKTYLSKIVDLSLQNIQYFQRANPLIYVQYSNVTIQNCSFTIHLANIIEIEQGVDINLLSLRIFNSTILQSPLIKLNLRTDLSGTIKMKNIEITDLSKFLFNQSNVCNQESTQIQDLLCPLVFQDINTNPIVEIQQDSTNYLECNLQKIYSITNYNFSLIIISNLQDNHYIYIQDVLITQIDCSVCYYGILSIQEFTNLNMQINKLNMINNTCGGTGCLSIINNGSTYSQFTTTISNSQFIQNTAIYGGACFFSNINIYVNNSLFANNHALQGGAIYYDSNYSEILFNNSQIVNNTANVAGGIYFSGTQLQKTTEFNLFISNNSATDSGNNLYEQPRYLQVSLNGIDNQKNKNLISNYSTIIDQVIVNPYHLQSQKIDIFMVPSGIELSKYKYFDSQSNSYISYNLTLRLTAHNVFGEQITDLENTKCTIQAQVINNSQSLLNYMNNNSSSYLSYTFVTFDSGSLTYNLDDLIIYFNPYTKSDLNLQLAFKCEVIQIPFYDSTSVSEPINIIKDYILLLNLRTFQCQLGEYFNETSGGCVLCDITQQQYSVSINATKCVQKDDLKINQILPAMIELKPDYWRPYYYSEVIEYCHNLLANCEGGWFAGNPSCAKGHIGALCEQCDLYNIKGQGSFSQNQSYQCSSCDDSASNILNIFLVVIWTLISVFITVTSTIKMIEDLVFSIKLKPLGFYTVIQSASTSVLMKVFTNYLQIISSISSFQLTIPIGITLVVRGVGNPIESMAFSLDCYLKIVSHISIIYFRIIWGFVMAGIYIFLFFSAHILITLLQKGKLNITFITTTFIYIYIYLSPNLVSGLSFLISYRNISDHRWIAANVAYLYNTEEHRNWLLYFVTPAFFVIGILLPLFFWYIVYHHRSQLHLNKIRKVWGYLYNEYKLTQYYWETIKIIQKELIILVLIYYEDYVTLKACLIFFILHIYSKLTTKYKPYQTSKLNNIDSLSNSTCKISIILAQSIYSAQLLGFIEIIWPFYTVLAIINIFFIIQMLQKIIFAYFEKLTDQLDNLKRIISYTFPTIISKNRFLQQIMRNSKERQQIVRKRFQKLRTYLLQQAKFILEFKKSNNMGLSSKEEQYEYQRTRKTLKLNTLLKASPTLKFCETTVL